MTAETQENDESDIQIQP